VKNIFSINEKLIKYFLVVNGLKSTAKKIKNKNSIFNISLMCEPLRGVLGNFNNYPYVIQKKLNLFNFFGYLKMIFKRVVCQDDEKATTLES